MKAFSITYFGDSQPMFIDGFGNIVDGNASRLSFDTQAEAASKLREIINVQSIPIDRQCFYMVVPNAPFMSVAPVVDQLPALPPPDFYEVGNPTTAAHIIEILSGDGFALCFTPVDNITGAGQMMSGLGLDPHDDRAVARSAKFSFPGWMEQAEIVKLHESATRNGKWKNCRVINRGNGFAKWFIVTLSSELR